MGKVEVIARNLIIDGALIYPAEPPATALYELTRPLDGSGKVIGILMVTAKSSANRDDDRHLYDFKAWLDRHSILELVGMRRTTYRHVMFSKGFGLTGRHWTVRSNEKTQTKVLLVARGGRGGVVWRDGDGKIVAYEKKMVAPTASEHSSGFPSLELQCSMEKRVMDLLVTAWCARIWQAAAASNKAKRSFKDCESCLFRRNQESNLTCRSRSDCRDWKRASEGVISQSGWVARPTLFQGLPLTTLSTQGVVEPLDRSQENGAVVMHVEGYCGTIRIT